MLYVLMHMHMHMHTNIFNIISMKLIEPKEMSVSDRARERNTENGNARAVANALAVRSMYGNIDWNSQR